MTLKPGETIGRLPARKKVVVGGELVQLYSIGWMAVMTGRSVQSIRLWERKGWLPKPIVSLPNHPDRWYLGVEIETYTRIFQQVKPSRQTSFQKTGFRELAHKAQIDLRAQLAKKNPAMFAPLSQQEKLEQAALRAQMERKTVRQIRVLTAAQRQAKRDLLKLALNK